MTVSGYSGPRRPLVGRMIAAATFDISVYEEVEADTSATGQAAIVVALAAIATGIGAMLGPGDGNPIGALLGSLIGWAVWAAVTYFIGKTVFKGTATWGELLRTLGFAQSPALLNVFSFIPVVGWLVSFVVGIWVLITGIIAIRQALDISTVKAVVVAILGWLALMVVATLFGGAALLGFMAGR